MKRIVLIIIGLISLGFGFLGAILPLMPAVPFLLLSAVCFAKSSQRLNNWFIGTKLYRNNLESYARGQGMTVKVKVKILFLISGLMLIGFYMLRRFFIGQVILFFIWLFHIIYFIWGIKTIKVNRG